MSKSLGCCPCPFTCAGAAGGAPASGVRLPPKEQAYVSVIQQANQAAAAGNMVSSRAGGCGCRSRGKRVGNGSKVAPAGWHAASLLQLCCAPFPCSCLSFQAQPMLDIKLEDKFLSVRTGGFPSAFLLSPSRFPCPVQNFNLLAEFTQACKANEDKTHETVMSSLWALLSDILKEAKAQNVPASSTTRFTEALLQGGAQQRTEGGLWPCCRDRDGGGMGTLLQGAAGHAHAILLSALPICAGYSAYLTWLSFPLGHPLGQVRGRTWSVAMRRTRATCCCDTSCRRSAELTLSSCGRYSRTSRSSTRPGAPWTSDSLGDTTPPGSR